MILKTKPIRARGWWIVGLAEAPPRLIVAPLGRYLGARVVDLVGPADEHGDSDGLARFLGLVDVDLTAPGAAEALAGHGWVELDGAPAWEVPAPSASRALLVGPRPAAGDLGRFGRYGPRPFEHKGGELLARALAIGELSALLGTFETAYADTLPAGRMHGRHVVALDMDPARLDIHAAASCVALQSTMPRAALSGALLRATLAARRGPGPLTEAEAEVVGLVGAADGAAVGVPHALHDAWSLAGTVGVAWPGSCPGEGWKIQVGPKERHLARDFCGVLAEVVGPPWRATAIGPAGRVARECSDVEAAVLVAERLARTLGGMTPWDRRDVALAATGRAAQPEGGA